MPTPTRRYSGLAGFDIGTTDVIPGFDVKTPDVAAPSTPPPERSLIDNHELITDLARYAENLCSESAIRKKWKLDEATWELLGDSDELIRAVEEEQVRRVRSGQLKREKAQAHIVRGVDVLATVMDNPRANDRHRIDSIRALDQLADPGPQAGVEQERI